MINLSNNSIASLPDELFSPLNSTTGGEEPLVLNLEGNLLTSLPVLSLPRLTELNLARNRLAHLHVHTLKHTTALRRIDLSRNDIVTIEPSIIYHELPIRAFIKEGDALFHGNLKNISEIDLSHNRLRHFPSVLYVRPSLKSLILKGNQISDFVITPLSYKYGYYLEFDSLEVLDLSNNTLGQALTNRIDEMHRKVYKYGLMPRLKQLDLSENGITLSQCSTDQSLSWLPPDCDMFLESMKALEVLAMAHNDITVVPEYFSHLVNLRRADFRYNKIKEVAYDNLFFTNGVSLGHLIYHENDYLRKGDYFELPNSHNLTVDLRYNDISAIHLPDKKNSPQIYFYHASFVSCFDTMGVVLSDAGGY
ncbi:insulin-like growth factor-binding protein complex acid labile subunit [Hetaerina americana]|uniref:insulin-like growth factor-binding protein complex acid labile subunit n=1 Tax=Hetaerina americana TaxID=62018 RepID=UPI003A7F3449